MKAVSWILFLATMFVFAVFLACYSQVEHPPNTIPEGSNQLIKILERLSELSTFNKITILLGILFVISLTYTINRTLKKTIAGLGNSVKDGLAEGMEKVYERLEPRLSDLLTEASTVTRKFTPIPRKIYETLGDIRKVLGPPLKTVNPELSLEIEEVDNLLYEREFDDAGEKIQKLTEKYPNHEDVLILNSKYHAGIGDWNASEELLDKAERVNPRNPEVYFVRGQNRSAQEKYQEAELLYRRATELNSEDGRYFLSLGYSLWKQDRIDDAIEQTEHVNTVSPDNPRIKLLAANNLAYYYALKDDVDCIEKALAIADGLVELLDSVQKRKPKGDQQYETRAHVYLRVYERKEKDEKWLKKSIQNSLVALDINPTNKYAQTSLQEASRLLLEHTPLSE